MVKVAMMQPTFLPWQGFFELILKSDKFIFLDDFQLSVQSHQTRNKLFVGKNQVGYYLVPIQKSISYEQALNKTLIVADVQWKNKMLRTLEYNYSKTLYFDEIFEKINPIIKSDISILSQLNMEIIKILCDILQIKSTFLLSSEFSKDTNSQSSRIKKVEELLDWSSADEYLCANGAFDYMKEDGYNYKKYPVIFQNYVPKIYEQKHSQEFIPYLSVLDALFNVGPEATFRLIESGTQHWLSWEERDVLLM